MYKTGPIRSSHCIDIFIVSQKRVEIIEFFLNHGSDER